MLARRPSVAIVFAFVLSAMVLSSAAESASRSSPGGNAGDVVAASQIGWPDVSLVRLTAQDQHSVSTLQRSTKQQAMFLSLVTVVAVAALLGRRRSMLLAEAGQPSVSWRSPRAERAPPSLPF